MSEHLLDLRRNQGIIYSNAPFNVYEMPRTRRAGQRRSGRLQFIFGLHAKGSGARRKSKQPTRRVSDRKSSTTRGSLADNDARALRDQLAEIKLRVANAKAHSESPYPFFAASDFLNSLEWKAGRSDELRQWILQHLSEDFSVVRVMEGIPNVVESLFQTVTDIRNPSQQRVSAFYEWLQDDPETASEYLLDELERSTDSQWLSWLVILSEDTWFDSENDRNRLIERLLSIASSSLEGSIETESVVTRKAIRRAGLLLPANQLSRLLPFTRADNVTRAETLAVIRSVLEVEQPTDSLPDCCERIRELTITFSNPDVYAIGQTDAMLFDCVVALALLGDPKLIDLLEALKKLKKPYLLSQLRESLKNIHSNRVSEGHGGQTVERALAEIERLDDRAK